MGSKRRVTSRTLALTLQQPTRPSADPGILSGVICDGRYQSRCTVEALRVRKFCDLADGSSILMCIASDSHAIWLGNVPSRGKAIHSNAAHFEPEAKAHHAADLANAGPAQREMSFG